MKKEVSSERFEQIQKELKKSESATKSVPIGAIEVNADSLKHNQILVSGNPIAVTPLFFTKMGQMLKLNSSLTKDMIKRGDHQMASALINGLKDYASQNKKNTEVILIANIKTKKLMDICEPKRYRRVTNDTLFDVTSRILGDNGNLSIETVDFNPHTGATNINLLNNNEIGFAQAGKDEFFKFGFSIIQTTKDTIVESYNQRLVCSNGMRASLGSGVIGGTSDKSMSFEDKFRLGGTSAEDVKMFLERIDAMRKADFQPVGFENAINRAVGTKASLYEIENACRLAMSKIDEPDPELKKSYQGAVARNYFHALEDTKARILKKGKDHAKLVDRQKQFIKTGMSVWDVVNSMTFLGSNNSGIPLSNQYELKQQAGQLFGKAKKEGYDLEFAQFANL